MALLASKPPSPTFRAISRCTFVAGARKYAAASLAGAVLAACCGMPEVPDPPPSILTDAGNRGFPISEAAIATHEFLSRFPVGTPTEPLLAYLHEIGAACREQVVDNYNVECSYSTWLKRKAAYSLCGQEPAYRYVWTIRVLNSGRIEALDATFVQDGLVAVRPP